MWLAVFSILFYLHLACITFLRNLKNNKHNTQHIPSELFLFHYQHQQNYLKFKHYHHTIRSHILFGKLVICSSLHVSWHPFNLLWVTSVCYFRDFKNYQPVLSGMDLSHSQPGAAGWFVHMGGQLLIVLSGWLQLVGSHMLGLWWQAMFLPPIVVVDQLL